MLYRLRALRALRPNFGPVTPRAGARVPPGPKFGKADTLSATANRRRGRGLIDRTDRSRSQCSLLA